MQSQKLETIDDVIQILSEIITETKTNNNPLGYFAALYQKVTINVKNGIENNNFENGKRMEKLDIIFAKRYIEAYINWHNNEHITNSWKITFEFSEKYRPIVLQHLLLGMNAHINLDLGIAAAKISENSEIEELKNDFNKINEILSSLVQEVQDNMVKIWPMLNKLLKISGKADDFLVDFSMQLARDGAWKFAQKLSKTKKEDWGNFIAERDKKVTQNTQLVINPGRLVRFLFSFIRIGERGTVSEKIEKLQATV